jgi:signal transduction histidine kinase
MAAAALVTVGLVVYLLWQGVSRITTPVRLLVEQTVRLAAGESIERIPAQGIDEIDVLERAFAQMATQIASYRAGLRRYAGAITQSQEDELRRVARDLHDETIQSLVTMARRLELLQASEGDPERLARLGQLQTMVTNTVEGVRQISHDLRPLILEDLGLIPALRGLIRLAHEGEGAVPHAKLEISGEPAGLGAEQELALYRITQEALTNVRKHARATGVRVSVGFDSTAVRLEISDDGRGFEVPDSLTQLAQRGNFGLMGIQERVWAVGGSLSIKSTAGQGTRVSVTMPVECR